MIPYLTNRFPEGVRREDSGHIQEGPLESANRRGTEANRSRGYSGETTKGRQGRGHSQPQGSR